MNLTTLNLNAIPASLRALPQWILWRLETRDDDKPTKVPYQPDCRYAKTTDSKTWTEFDKAAAVANRFSGLGFVFSKDDTFCGIDLDGCRNPETGTVAEWARKIILSLASYAEVSPSQTGVKIWIIGKNPMDRGRKIDLPDVEKVCDKEPAIEVYDERRYFAVTGWRLKGVSTEPEERQEQLDSLCAKHFAEKPVQIQENSKTKVSVVDRARKYLATMPPAISGQSGHTATFKAACVLVQGFALGEADSLSLMREFSKRCTPPWSERDLLHKVKSAGEANGWSKGCLRDAKQERLDSFQIPECRYQAPVEPAAPEPRITTLPEAAKAYLDSIRGGQSPLVELGLPDLEYAIGGGVERGELIVFAARPSHGKSAVALQCIHHWTSQGLPCAIVSEEMSAIALGKRTLQFISAAPQEHWSGISGQLDSEIDAYAAGRAPAIILEGCGSATGAVEAVERAVGENGIQCLVVDYAQLLKGHGRSRYEQMTEVSLTLRRLASKHKLILLALCQMSRDIEGRGGKFKPTMADIKETGQFEQDADVIVFLCWPWRINSNENMAQYQFYIEKNRNRPINQRIVDCFFDPSRQMFSLSPSGISEPRREVMTPFDNTRYES